MERWRERGDNILKEGRCKRRPSMSEQDDANTTFDYMGCLKTSWAVDSVWTPAAFTQPHLSQHTLIRTIWLKDEPPVLNASSKVNSCVSSFDTMQHLNPGLTAKWGPSPSQRWSQHKIELLFPSHCELMNSESLKLANQTLDEYDEFIGLIHRKRSCFKNTVQTINWPCDLHYKRLACTGEDRQRQMYSDRIPTCSNMVHWARRWECMSVSTHKCV